MSSPEAGASLPELKLPGGEAPVRSLAPQQAALSARGVRKHYTGGDGSLLRVLDGVDFDIARGEAVSVIGRSGSGKSTLLQVLGGLDEADEGQVDRRHAAAVAGHAARGHPRRCATRAAPHGRGRAGPAAQREDWLRVPVPSPAAGFSALENVMMPPLIQRMAPDGAQGRAISAGRAGERPRTGRRELSGGEQQRVAMARALVSSRAAAGRRTDRQPRPRDRRGPARRVLPHLPRRGRRAGAGDP